MANNLRNTKKKPLQPWRAFEAPPGLVRASADWKRLLGSHYESARDFFRLQSGVASAIPCPAKAGCGCYHAVIVHGRDDLVSVCRCSPKRCEAVSIKREDALIYEINRSKLGAAIAQALGIKAEEREVDGLRTTWQFGTYFPRATFGIPFYMAIPIDPDEMLAVAEGLTARFDKPFVLVAPTPLNWRPEYDDILQRRKARFLALADIINWNGNLSAIKTADKLLAELVEESLPPPEAEQAIRNENGIWRVTYDGVTISITDSKGITYIAYLLLNPGQEIPAFELQAVTRAAPVNPSFGDSELRDGGTDQEYGSMTSGSVIIAAGSIADQKSLDLYRQKIAELEDEMREAKRNNDTGRYDSLKQEEYALIQELGRIRNRRGKLRKRDAAEDARQNVSKAIHRILKPMKKSHYTLWQHLSNSLKIASSLSYRPEKPTVWAP